MLPYTYWITNSISDTCNLSEYTGALLHALACRRQSIDVGNVNYLYIMTVSTGLLCEKYLRDESCYSAA